MSVRRVNFVCRRCRAGAHPLDERLGIEGSTSQQAERLMCLAGASWSFDVGARRLKEFCGLTVSDNQIRAICQKQASPMAQWQRDAVEATEPFRKAAGQVEFTTDGTSVNTWEGWRETRLGIFAKRRCGPPATADQWAQRELPPTEVRVAFAAIEKSDRFGSRWSRWTQRLGIRDTSQISVLADGARWIWEETSMHLAGAGEVLDIYHALEHVADTARILHGEGTAAAKAWRDACRQDLLSGGWPAIEQRLEHTKTTARRKTHRHSLTHLTAYLAHNQTRLTYPQRLQEGRAIGSGQAEGACKHMIGRRLKQTGARWRVRRVNRMANLCCLMYSDQWDTYWARN